MHLLLSEKIFQSLFYVNGRFRFRQIIIEAIPNDKNFKLHTGTLDNRSRWASEMLLHHYILFA